jgi:excisionase family DNA binding protein
VPERLLNVEEVAEQLGVPVSTLHYWNHRGEGGPPCAVVGNRLKYRQADVDAWIAARFAERQQRDAARAAARAR